MRSGYCRSFDSAVLLTRFAVLLITAISAAACSSDKSTGNDDPQSESGCRQDAAGDVHLVCQDERTVGMCYPSKLPGVMAVSRPAVFVGPGHAEVAVALERYFVLELDAPDGSEPILVNGVIDRIDRHPDGSIEIIDYKTGRSKSQTQVDNDDQLSTYALAMARGAVTDDATGEPLPAASKLTLYFTESDTAVSTTRTPEQLEEHAGALTSLALSLRSGDFTAMPA